MKTHTTAAMLVSAALVLSAHAASSSRAERKTAESLDSVRGREAILAQLEHAESRERLFTMLDGWQADRQMQADAKKLHSFSLTQIASGTGATAAVSVALTAVAAALRGRFTGKTEGA